MDAAAADFDEYTSALGRFISMFAEIETLVRVLLHNEVGISEKKLESLIGTPTIAPCIDILRAYATLSGMPEKTLAAVDQIFSQLKHIRDLRDRLVHCGGHPLGNGQILIRPAWKNRRTAGQPDTVFMLSDLEHARLDMITTRNKLVYHFHWKNHHEEFFQDLEPHVREPWLYKPRAPSQTSPRQKAKKDSP